MTGLVFATLSKFIEIGNIITVKPKEIPMSRAQKREMLEKSGMVNNKRNRKSLDKDEESEENSKNLRSIKHFSAVQNKQIYYPDIQHLENKIMMSIDVPKYWYLNLKDKLTPEELFQKEKIDKNVIFLKLKKSDKINHFGKREPTVNVF